MCGRFTQYYTYREVYDYLNLTEGTASNFQPRYHICPTDPIDVVVQAKAGGLKLERMRWGLVPYWWKEPLKKVPATFNARAETVDSKPFFRAAWRKRRCLIPASGYYEWQDRADGKQPWYFTPAKAPIFLIAGLWETWSDPATPGETLHSATMIITEPNTFVAQYHDRMPVLIGKEESGNWLSGAYGLERLVPAPNDWMKAHAVSRVVNSSKAPDSPDLIKEVTL
jgi:putative SOS response-associated peptidase YedK